MASPSGDIAFGQAPNSKLAFHERMGEGVTLQGRVVCQPHHSVQEKCLETVWIGLRRGVRSPLIHRMDGGGRLVLLSLAGPAGGKVERHTGWEGALPGCRSQAGPEEQEERNQAAVVPQESTAWCDVPGGAQKSRDEEGKEAEVNDDNALWRFLRPEERVRTQRRALTR